MVRGCQHKACVCRWHSASGPCHHSLPTATATSQAAMAQLLAAAVRFCAVRVSPEPRTAPVVQAATGYLLKATVQPCSVSACFRQLLPTAAGPTTARTQAYLATAPPRVRLASLVRPRAFVARMAHGCLLWERALRCVATGLSQRRLQMPQPLTPAVMDPPTSRCAALLAARQGMSVQCARPVGSGDLSRLQRARPPERSQGHGPCLICSLHCALKTELLCRRY